MFKIINLCTARSLNGLCKISPPLQPFKLNSSVWIHSQIFIKRIWLNWFLKSRFGRHWSQLSGPEWRSSIGEAGKSGQATWMAPWSPASSCKKLNSKWDPSRTSETGQSHTFPKTGPGNWEWDCFLLSFTHVALHCLDIRLVIFCSRLKCNCMKNECSAKIIPLGRGDTIIVWRPWPLSVAQLFPSLNLSSYLC